VSQFFAKHRVLTLGALLAIFTIPLCFRQLADVDIWWHLNLGRAYLENLGPPDPEAFYFSPVNPNIQDLRYIWLGDLVFYLIHAGLGDFGLQLLALTFTFLTFFLLLSATGRRLDAWAVLILFLLAAGVYQLQTVRNALFSLPLFALALWLWHRVRFDGRHRLYWLFPPMLAAWSCLHGSYLLGFGALGLLILGDLLDSLRGLNDKAGALFWRHLAVGGLSLLAVSLYNPLTWQTLARLNQPLVWALAGAGLAGVGLGYAVMRFKGRDWLLRRRKWIFRAALTTLAAVAAIGAYRFASPYFSDDISRAVIDLRNPDRMVEMARPGFFGKLKLALNNTFWKPEEHLIASSDFLSPFDDPGEIYVWTSLLLALACFAAFPFARPLRFSLLVPFLAVAGLGLGYKRTIGYLAIFAAYSLFALTSRKAPAWLSRQRPALGLALAGAATLYAGLIFGFDLGLWKNHRVAIGRAPYYADAVSEKVLERHLEQPTFTNVKSGGYLLYRWHPRKKVFFDGFFAPHRGAALRDYRKALMEQNPDLLFQRYDIELAVIALHDAKWISLFGRSEHWYPRYMDVGMIAFARQASFQRPPPPLELLLDEEDIRALPAYYRGVVANRLFELPTSYIVKGRNAEAHKYMETHEGLLRAIGDFAEEDVQQALSENLSLVESRYGRDNSKIIRYEFLFSEAVGQMDNEELVRYGRLILEAHPNRFDVRLSLARALFNAEDYAGAEAELEALQRARRADPAFWRRERQNVAQLWLRAAQTPAYRQAPLQRYRCWRMAHGVAPDFFDESRLRYEAMLLYENLLQARDIGKAFDLMERLRLDFPESGEVFFSLSWLMLEHSAQLNANLETAAGYALEAVRLMENAEDPNLDIIYFNAAKILSRIGDAEKANIYVEKARDAAPPDRRDRYNRNF